MHFTPPSFDPVSSLTDFVIKGHLALSKGMLAQLHATTSAVDYDRAATFLASVNARVRNLTTDTESAQLTSDMVAALFRDDGVFRAVAPADEHIDPRRSPADSFHHAAMLIQHRAHDLRDAQLLDDLGYEPPLFISR